LVYLYIGLSLYWYIPNLVYLYIGLSLYWSISILVYLYIGLSLYGYISILVYLYIDISLYWYISILVYLYMGISLYGYISIFVYLFVDLYRGTVKRKIKYFTVTLQNMVLPKQTSTTVTMSPGMTSAIFQETLLAHILDLKSKALNVITQGPGASSSKAAQKHLFFIDDLNTAPKTGGIS